MVDAYYEGEALLAPRKAAERIPRIFNVKNDRLSPSADESVETMARLISELGLDWTTRVVTDPTIETLEGEINAGHFVIVPVYAPTLRRTTFKPGDVDYHAIVLIGYDRARREFIANDPGTAAGKGVRFEYDLIMDTMHDLYPENYRAGRKAALFTENGTASSSLER